MDTGEEIPGPLIIKARIGSGSSGIRFVETRSQWDSWKGLDFDRFLIQARIENRREVKGTFFLFNKGTLVSYYGHRRIRTYPDLGA